MNQSDPSTITELIKQLLLFLETLGKDTVSDYSRYKRKLKSIETDLIDENLSKSAFREAGNYEDLVRILFQKRVNLEAARKRGQDLFD